MSPCGVKKNHYLLPVTTAAKENLQARSLRDNRGPLRKGWGKLPKSLLLHQAFKHQTEKKKILPN